VNLDAREAVGSVWLDGDNANRIIIAAITVKIVVNFELFDSVSSPVDRLEPIGQAHYFSYFDWA
jgi:hypothetical protein